MKTKGKYEKSRIAYEQKASGQTSKSSTAYLTMENTEIGI